MAVSLSDSKSDSGAVRADRERVEQAIRRLQAGIDVNGSFDFLFRRFSGPLQRQLVSWGSNIDNAHDLNQQVFQRIFQSVESFQGSEHLFESWVAWIWRIARTTWLRSGRYGRAAKRPQHGSSLEEIDEAGGQMAQPPVQLGRVLDLEARQLVRQAVGELPEQERKCVMLYYYQGMKTKEISVILRIAPGTVKAHLNHARSKLKSSLGSYFEFDEDQTIERKGEEQRV